MEDAMPTDIALVLMRKAEAEAQARKEVQTDLVITCLWVTLGLVLTALMFRFGFYAEIAESLLTAG
jgi:hypothetical protein